VYGYNSNHYNPTTTNTQNGNGLQTAQPNLANSPLAQFFNSNNLNNAHQARQGYVDVNVEPAAREYPPKVSAPPGFNTRVQPQKHLLNGSKETKLITPAMFAASNNNSAHNDKKPSVAEPLTKNQLLQAMNYLIENDDEFMKKVHEAYIKSFRTMAS
jgi:mRNA-decapping enzyme C-terminus